MKSTEKGEVVSMWKYPGREINLGGERAHRRQQSLRDTIDFLMQFGGAFGGVRIAGTEARQAGEAEQRIEPKSMDGD